jgi:hypothetical protein
VTVDVIGILLANLAYALLGLGLAAAAGVFDRRQSVVVRGLISAALGIAVIGLAASFSALAGLAVTPAAVALLVVVALAVGGWRLRTRLLRTPRERPTATPRPAAVDRALALVPALAIGGFVIAAARAIAVKPLVEWDGWVLWATKARVLYERPDEAAEILRAPYYGAPSYPLGLPALEATTMHAVGSFDNALVDLQILILVAAALVGMWALLSAVAHPLLIGGALLAPLASTQVAYQLTTNYADVPLAFLVALGVVAGAAWLAAGERRESWQLVCFAVFLSFAAWTKNEGLVFALAAIAALLAVTLVERRGRLAAVAAALGFALLVAPWRVYASAHDLRTYDYDLASFFDLAYLRDRSDRIVPASSELLSEMTKVDAWGASVAVIVLGVVTALLTSRRLVGLYAAVWLALSFCGLVATYWISSHRLDNDLENSSYRTVVTLIVGGLCLLPALLQPAVHTAIAVAQEWRARILSRRRDRPRPPATSGRRPG